MYDYSKKRVLLVGAGGIGSQLLDLTIPALTAGDLADRVGGIEFHVMDGDRVEQDNLTHQRHEPRMVGRLKVESNAERLAPYLSKSLTMTPLGYNLTDGEQLANFDLVIVAVDRPQARQIVHEHASAWLDLRCTGDGFVALDDQTPTELVEILTPTDQAPASCQLASAIALGNIQFGYALAAAHGAQWIVQRLRQMVGEPTRSPPERMFSLTYGRLQFPVLATVGGDE